MGNEAMVSFAPVVKGSLGMVLGEERKQLIMDAEKTNT